VIACIEEPQLIARILGHLQAREEQSGLDVRGRHRRVRRQHSSWFEIPGTVSSGVGAAVMWEWWCWRPTGVHSVVLLAKIPVVQQWPGSNLGSIYSH
jgi:hypothetical protein